MLQYFQGHLTMTSAYVNPFEMVCVKCSSPITSARTMNKIMLYCTIFNQDFLFIYFHQLNYIINENDTTEIQCVLRGVELEKVLHELWKVSYEQYCTNKSLVIDMLSNFETHGTFTINLKNVIVHLQRRFLLLHY